MFSNNPTVNSIVLTALNDGDGSQCGYSYKERVEAAKENRKEAFRQIARTLAPKDGAPFGKRYASPKIVEEAAGIIAAYYADHLKELGGVEHAL